MEGIDLNDSRSVQHQNADLSALGVGATNFDNQDADSIVDEMNLELEKLKEQLRKISTRCHVLHVDLAVQFSPYIVETLRNVKEDCQRCTSKIQLHLNANASNP